jgi:hypothetical protein
MMVEIIIVNEKRIRTEEIICLKVILPFYWTEHAHMRFEVLTVVKMLILVLQNVGM